MFFRRVFERRRKERETAARIENALAEMDVFFTSRPWKVLSLDFDIAGAAGSFAENAVKPEDFFDPKEEEVAWVFGRNR
ncbi:MAG: hypothetical protein LBQ79_05575 [Deltaproteobacteria bacterium]|jgi:hypothetical protein|nr:hypothetical protein [Deltaproteobacteria bacterium]